MPEDIQVAAPAAPQDNSNPAPEIEAADDIDEGSYIDGEEQSIQQDPSLTPSEKKSLIKKLKLKVDGQEVEEEINLEDDEALIKHLQKAKAFDKRSQEYAKLRNEVDMLVKMLQENPEDILEKMGLNVDDLAERRIESRLKQMEKSPEQVKQEKMEAELEELRQEKKRMQEEKTRAEEEKLRQKYAIEFETEIVNALDSSSTILAKKNPKTIQKVGQYLLMAFDAGLTNVKASDIIPVVEKEYKEDLADLFNAMPEETIEALVGKNNLERLRKKRLSTRKVSTETARQVAKDVGPKKVEKKEESKPKRMKDMFGLLDD